MTIEDDYTEADRWDWDQEDSSQCCQHGTFIGSWWGPDILCWACEDGLSLAEYELVIAHRSLRRVEEQINRLWPFNEQMMQTIARQYGWNSEVIDFLEKHADKNGDQVLALMAVAEDLAERIADMQQISA